MPACRISDGFSTTFQTYADLLRIFRSSIPLFPRVHFLKSFLNHLAALKSDMQHQQWIDGHQSGQAQHWQGLYPQQAPLQYNVSLPPNITLQPIGRPFHGGPRPWPPQNRGVAPRPNRPPLLIPDPVPGNNAWNMGPPISQVRPRAQTAPMFRPPTLAPPRGPSGMQRPQGRPSQGNRPPHVRSTLRPHQSKPSAVVPAVQKGAKTNEGKNKTSAAQLKRRLEKLDKEDAKPKRARVLSPAEIEDGKRWQAERKANFPSESNLARKEEASKAIADSGGLDPNAQTRRLSLSQIVQKQREMGLSKAAGTEGFVFDTGSSRRGRGRGQRGRGRSRGMSQTSNATIEYHQPPAAQPMLSNDAGEDLPETDNLVNGVSMHRSSEPAGASELIGGKQGDAPEIPNGKQEANEAATRQTRDEKASILLHPKTPEPHALSKSGNTFTVSAIRGPKKYSRPPLLKQLLATEIRQERSHLLQCLRFFVVNEFLQSNEPLVFPSSESQASCLKDELDLDHDSDVDSEKESS